MRICYVISTSELAGGANRSLLDMILLVKKAGHECFVLGPSYGSMAEELKKNNIDYEIIPFKSSVKFGNLLRNSAKYLYNLWIRQSIKKLLINKKIDIVHNNSLPTLVGMEAAYSLKIPYICHIRENVWKGLGMEFIRNFDVHKDHRVAQAPDRQRDHPLRAGHGQPVRPIHAGPEPVHGREG